MTFLECRHGPRWAFFMREAASSLKLAKSASTALERRLWLVQALSELERAAECIA